VVIQFPVRQGARHRRPPWRRAGERVHEGLPVLRQLEPLVAGLGDQFESVPGTGQTPVERVDRRAPHHGTSAGRHLEGRGQQLVQGRKVERRRTGRAGASDVHDRRIHDPSQCFDRSFWKLLETFACVFGSLALRTISFSSFFAFGDFAAFCIRLMSFPITPLPLL
jgi:hypothetical protein